jgi:hypothetical protein
MSHELKKPKIAWFLLFICLILLSNYSLYHLPLLSDIPKEVALGSILDFLIVIPILTYFMIIRKRYSLKYIGIVLLAGYGAAYFIIPNQHLNEYPFFSYIVVASEGIFILIELYILIKIASNLPKLVREYKRINNDSSLFLKNTRLALEKTLPNQRVLQVFFSEFSMFYYSLFSWKKNVSLSSEMSFTYHKKTSSTALYFMLIHATVLESVGLHYFLHQWNEVVSYILLALNVYGVLFFIAEIQATRLSPFVLTDEDLYLQVGFSKSMTISSENIKHVQSYEGPEKFTKDELKTMFDARVIDFMQEKPMFEIQLKQPQTLHLLYGFSRQVDRIVLNVDDPNTFYNELKNRIPLD